MHNWAFQIGDWDWGLGNMLEWVEIDWNILAYDRIN